MHRCLKWDLGHSGSVPATQPLFALLHLLCLREATNVFQLPSNCWCSFSQSSCFLYITVKLSDIIRKSTSNWELKHSAANAGISPKHASLCNTLLHRSNHYMIFSYKLGFLSYNLSNFYIMYGLLFNAGTQGSENIVSQSLQCMILLNVVRQRATPECGTT